MQLFVGKGYSDEFTKNMYLVISALENNFKNEVCFVSDMDDICSKCPNKRHDNTCVHGNERIIERDKKVLEILQLKANTPYKYTNLLNILNNNINEAFSTCCGTCSWNEDGTCSIDKLKKHLNKLIVEKNK